MKTEEKAGPNQMQTTNVPPKVSVIVPVYKVDKYLVGCLDSIVNQTLKEIEIIIVDEGDKDRCREIIDFYEKADPRIVAPHQKNGGYGASCNLGISMAKGEYISIIESDDFIEPEMLEEMYIYAKKLSADVVKTPYYEYHSNGAKNDCPYRAYMQARTPSNTCFSLKQYSELLAVHASLWSGLYRTQYMRDKQIKFVEARGGAYVDVGFRIDTLINTDRVAWLDKPFYNYRVDAIGSSTNNFSLPVMLKRWREVHEKYADRQEEFEKYYSPRLIRDEYLNSVGWLWLMDATAEDYKAISYNLTFASEEMIRSTESLSDNQRRDLLLFKSDPKKFHRRTVLYKAGKRMKSLVVDRLANPMLLLWAFVGYMVLLISGLAKNLSTQFGPFIPFSANILFTFAMLCLLLILLCFAAKIVNKLYNIAWKSRHRKA